MIQTSLLDAIEAESRKQEGMRVAVDHAEKEEPGWAERAYGLLKEFLQETPGEFMAEQVRSYAAMIDFPLPPHARAWGAIFCRAKKEGLIYCTRIGQVSNVKAHRANANVWRVNK